jgi:hypothetical protein
MTNRNFLVTSLGPGDGSSRRVVIEADVLQEGMAQVKIIDIEDRESVIFNETVDESTIEGLQNFFIMIRNEMGRERLSVLAGRELTS